MPTLPLHAVTYLALEVGDESSRAMWTRVKCVVAGAIGGYLYEQLGRGAIFAVTALAALLTALWTSYYGWDDAVSPGITTLVGCALSMICNGKTEKQHAKSH